MSKDFSRKKVAYPEIDKTNLDNDFDACGLEMKPFQQKFESVFETFNVDPSTENPMAVLTEIIENGFSKREIAFLVAKDISEQVRAEIENESISNNEK